jgi:CRISPR-associated endonuclease/helicase Cas3
LGGGEQEEDLDPDHEATLAGEVIEALRSSVPNPWLSQAEWEGFLDSLSPEVVRPLDGAPYLRRQRNGRQRSRIRTEVFDELSFVRPPQVLTKHLGNVARCAGLMAGSIGCDEPLIQALRLAGQLHDLGKLDPRFQRWLDPDAESPEPLAKSDAPRGRWESMRAASGWPKGGRHELLSSQIAVQWLATHAAEQEVDLILHLILSHHGEGRPFVRAVDDAMPMSIWTEIRGEPVTAKGNLSAVDWGQPTRFRRLCERYGYWGLSLLEAVLRLADHAVSQIPEVI